MHQGYEFTLCLIFFGVLLFVWLMIEAFTFDIRFREFQAEWCSQMDVVMAKDSKDWTLEDRTVVNGRIPWSWEHPFDRAIGYGSRSSLTGANKSIPKRVSTRSAVGCDCGRL